MKYVLVLQIWVLCLLTSCSIIEKIGLTESGKVVQKSFNVTVPFEQYNDWIIITTRIGLSDYRFLLDTGAPNVVSKKLAAKLNLRTLKKIESEDSQRVKSKLEVVKLDTVCIGGLEFVNTAAVVADLRQSKEIACMNIDGLIGSNLMAKAVWKIDYQSRTISISSSDTFFQPPEVACRVKVKLGASKNMYATLKLDDSRFKETLLFDTGSNGGISLSDYSVKKIVADSLFLNENKVFGITSGGLNGLGKSDTTSIVRLGSVWLGEDLFLSSMLASEGKKSLIGNKFLKDYDVVFNWFKREVLLIQKTSDQNPIIESFGFSFSLFENKLAVTAITKNSPAFDSGLMLGDHIIILDDVSYQTVTDQQYCDLIFDRASDGRNDINIVVLRNGLEMRFNLKKGHW